ncbi:hypothetical protein [Paenibacillus xylanexedens]|uniref:hypothetical protein n=1 Tax=Paenibacillus xylanexedens TaxID=528191 RepID=UPI00119CF2C3|nr:hypothetical protein [Paenibacillus xylanexedens]
MRSIEKLFKVELPLEELLKLDGSVSDNIQNIINEAKKEASYGFNLPVMNEIIKQSEKIGKLTWSHKQIKSCDYCDKKSDYYTYPRSGKYHRKGDKNWNKPIYYSGIKFNEGFVSIQGHGDMCLGCCDRHKVKERLIDYIIEKDLKIQIMRNEYRQGTYLKDDIRICFNCDEEMLESQMSKERTMMGNGFYPSGCPKCGSKSIPFGRNHKVTNKFGFIKNPESCVEVVKIKELLSEYNKEKLGDDRLNFNQSSQSINTFSIKEEKWSNGYKEVLQFTTNSKKFVVGHTYKDKCENFKQLLLNHGYTEN